MKNNQSIIDSSVASLLRNDERPSSEKTTCGIDDMLSLRDFSPSFAKRGQGFHALLIFISLFLCFPARGQELDLGSGFRELSPFIQSLRNFSNHIPQEKVYLHFDNTSYYQGDHVWFKCYVTSAQHQFYNNSKSKNFRINAETVTPNGTIGIFKRE